jgi:hypothetical protein
MNFVKKAPYIFNVAMTNEDTEYSQQLPEGTKAFLLKLRGQGASLKYAYISGRSGSEFVTIPTGSPGKYLDGVFLHENRTLYFQSPVASQVAEIEVWV